MVSALDDAPYARILQGFVDAHGWVDYQGMKANRADLDQYARNLAHLDPAVYERLEPANRMALWINAYNALTLEAIVSNYPIQPRLALRAIGIPSQSIRQLPGVWEKLSFTVMGKPVTLNQIEHEILRPMGDPRIHVAINCASVGCPPLRAEPYRAGDLSRQLDEMARRFLREKPETKVVIDRERKTVAISPIFRWFADDFLRYGEGGEQGWFSSGASAAERGVLGFISTYLDRDDAEFLRTGSYSVAYRPYDWSLNQQPRRQD
jgi:hypothetical protein